LIHFQYLYPTLLKAASSCLPLFKSIMNQEMYQQPGRGKLHSVVFKRVWKIQMVLVLRSFELTEIGSVYPGS
jgi:hypothetical protein